MKERSGWKDKENWLLKEFSYFSMKEYIGRTK
jgi:hypothetical protein